MGRCVVSCVVVLWMAATSVWGVTRTVPGQYRRVQSAIQACKTGDTVVVSPGVYRETINFGGKDIVVTSTDPNDPKVVESTVIDAEEDGTVVTFENGETPAAVLAGFTITGGVGTVDNEIENSGIGGTFWGGGIYCIGASPTITRNVISNNHLPFNLNVTTAEEAEIGYGGGIVCLECSPVITHNIIRGNSAYVGGGVLSYIAEPIISNNIVYDNSAVIGGGVVLVGGLLLNNTIVGNAVGLDGTSGEGGNLYIVDDPIAGFWQASNNIICNAASGGGVYLEGGAVTNGFTFNNVWGNLPVDYVSRASGPGQMGNISADPGFANASGKDYHLTTASPCVNAGDPATDVAAGAADMDGNARVYARRIDIGADEFTGYVKPVAFAGLDQHVLSPDQPVTLDGRQSFFADPCGVATFRWSQVEGAPVILSDPNIASPTFVPGALGRYVFELAVTDGQNAGESDRVLVLAAANTPPVAEAGADRVWQAPGTVMLDGRGSCDSEPMDRLSFRWTQVEGPAVDLHDADTATPSFDCNTPAQYAFELVVNDGFEDSQAGLVRHLTTSVMTDVQDKDLMPAGTVACYYPDISAGKVVYTANGQIALGQITCKDLYTDQVTSFSGGGMNLQPKVDGDLVVWWGGVSLSSGSLNSASVFVRDLPSGSQQTLAARNSTSSFSHPVICGRKVVWVQHLGLDTSRPDKWYAMPYDICGADITNLQKPKYFTVATGVGRCDPLPLSNPTASPDVVGISGNLVVWEGQGDIFAADISDLNDVRIYTVCDDPARQHDPAISGRLVVWTDERNDRGDIYGADLSDLSHIRELKIVKRSGMQQQPALDGTTVAYTDGQGYSGAVRLAYVTRSHGVLDVDPGLPRLAISVTVEGTTLVTLQGLTNAIHGYSLGGGYSIFDGPVQNSRSGLRYDSIEHAILAAERGDEIVVGQGHYSERINYAGKAVTIRSTDPADPAVVAATTLGIEGDVVAFISAEDANSVLDGLTITGGRGIVCSTTSPMITRCNITGNCGAGLRLMNQSNPTFTYCSVTGNGGAGADMWAPRVGRVVRNSEATFRNCLIAGNRLQGIASGRTTITNCTIVENLREGTTSISPVVTNSILYFNGRGGPGIAQINGSYATVTFSDIEGGGWEGDGNIDAEPLFARTGSWVGDTAWIAGDYHLKSQGRRWDALNGLWASDDVTSPCIDAGDPAWSLGDEPVTVGEQQYVNTRIDMGVYGGTPEASLAP